MCRNTVYMHFGQTHIAYALQYVRGQIVALTGVTSPARWFKLWMEQIYNNVCVKKTKPLGQITFILMVRNLSDRIQNKRVAFPIQQDLKNKASKFFKSYFALLLSGNVCMSKV